MQEIEQLRFLSEGQVRKLATEHGTPIYVYSKKMLKKAADEVFEAFKSAPYGLTVRYAMKANPHPEVVKTLMSQGIVIDASSEYEAKAAIEVGAKPSDILLTSQQPPKDLNEILELGIPFTATSLYQLGLYGQAAPGTKVSLRLNTGLGSGINHRLTTGGIEVGFGIWFHSDDGAGKEIDILTKKYNLEVERVHIHIGTGSDPKIWGQLMDAGLEALRFFDKATILNLGGGFKLPYMDGDEGADLKAIGMVARKKLEKFFRDTGRKILLEIEPGRYLTARAGAIISTIVDKTDTGVHGDDFLKIDSGLTEIVRTAMYGSHHPLVVVDKDAGALKEISEYVVIGHCCESSDLLTPSYGDPEKIHPRQLQFADIGDYIVVEMAGAYCASMSLKGYNSFPVAKEVVIE